MFCCIHSHKNSSNKIKNANVQLSITAQNSLGNNKYTYRKTQITIQKYKLQSFIRKLTMYQYFLATETVIYGFLYKLLQSWVIVIPLFADIYFTQIQLTKPPLLHHRYLLSWPFWKHKCLTVLSASLFCSSLNSSVFSVSLLRFLMKRRICIADIMLLFTIYDEKTERKARSCSKSPTQSAIY